MSHLILIDHFTICFLKEIGNERNFIIEKSKLIEIIVSGNTKHHLTENGHFQYKILMRHFTLLSPNVIGEDPPVLVLSLSFY